ncbi:MAG: pyruvate ferredoxin oxidoreductase [Candidatus Cloacimonetes bacterium 4572_55]|nr:MAG: pyruvate ferredoxin oxidoreductase [Candidatus Cloacimonetes bacterium 4572_55]
MVEIRLHGRGGQGVVVASKMLSKGFFKEGYVAQTFPKYGVERRGAPAAAFVRVAKEEGRGLIGIRSEIYEPDHIIVLDPTLITAINVTQGLKKNGWVIINAPPDRANFGDRLKDYRVAVVDASHIAVEHKLGSAQAPVVNSAILGGFAKVYQAPAIGAVIDAIKEEAPVKPQENADAAAVAYQQIVVLGGE